MLRAHLVKDKLMREIALFAIENFPDPKPPEADIQNLINASTYAKPKSLGT